MAHLYIFFTILFTVAGQLIAKWRITFYASQIPQPVMQKIFFTAKLIADPFILLSYICAFLASLFWFISLSKFSLNYAYPFMGLSFLLVMFLSMFFFHEAITWSKLIGTLCMVSGLIILSAGHRLN